MITPYRIQLRNKIDGYLLDLAEVKSWLRVSYDTDDALLQSLIEGAETLFEEYTGRTVSKANISLVYKGEDINEKIISLPYPPMVGVLASYGDSYSNALHFEFNTANNTVVITDDTSEYNEVVIAYEAESNGTDKIGIKILLLQIIALMYDNRGDVNYSIDISQIKGIQKYNMKGWF